MAHSTPLNNKTIQRIIKEDSQLIIIKVGSVLVRGTEIDAVNQPWIDALAQDIKELHTNGKKVIIISSGGVALGRKALGIAEDVPPSTIPLAKKQAASAVGQYSLFDGYNNAFTKQGITTAQILLTMSETENRRTNLNARETLHTLLDHDIVPIINENDTVSTGEIRFGDNDRLSVRVAQMVMADTVILLSTTDGLYTDNPDKNSDAKHIALVEHIEQEHIQMAGDAVPGLSTGGMKSKIEAAISATKSGINLIITEGRENHPIQNLLENEDKKSTLFTAQENNDNARNIWIAEHMNPEGAVIVDDGALEALQNGKSLLPIGVKDIEGNFKRGDVIEIKTLDGSKAGMGLSAYNSADARRIAGCNSKDIIMILGYAGRNTIIHQNDLVLIES